MVTLLVYRGRSRQAGAVGSRTAGEEGGQGRRRPRGDDWLLSLYETEFLSVEPSLGAGCFYEQINDLRGYLAWEQKRRKGGAGDAAV